MNFQKLKELLVELIVAGEYNRVFPIMTKVIKKDSELYTNFKNLEGQLETIRKEEWRGLLAPGQKIQSLNFIRVSLLEIIQMRLSEKELAEGWISFFQAYK